MDEATHQSGDNMIHTLAHAGHDHSKTAPPLFSLEIWVSLGAISLLIVIFVLMHYVFKIKPSTQLLIIMGYLLVAGVGTYQYAPVVSIVALASGMAVALATTLFQLTAKSK